MHGLKQQLRFLNDGFKDVLILFDSQESTANFFVCPKIPQKMGNILWCTWRWNSSSHKIQDLLEDIY